MVLDNLLTELGMKPPLSHLQRVEVYINNRKEVLGLNNSGYLEFLKEDKNEYYMLLDIITVNETYLFREQRHFDLLLTYILPKLKREQKQIKIWSAACSTGEEVISLYVICKTILKRGEFFLTASDINNHSLKLFREGKLSVNSFRADGEKYHHLIPDRDKIDPEILKDIEILNLNLFQMNTKPVMEMYDIIFLRNTLIYFTQENKTRVIEYLVDRLKPGGYLFVSVTEVPFIKNRDLQVYEGCGCFYFKKESVSIEEKEQVIEVTREPEVIEEKTFSYIKCLEYCLMTSRDNSGLTEDQTMTKEYKNSLSVKKILGLIDRNDRKYVEVELKKLENSPIKHYLLGYCLYVSGEHLLAIEEFNRCLSMNKEFWPARFYISSISPKKEDIEKCLEQIDLYIRDGKRYFDILLDGFDARYFKNICNNWIK